MRYAKRKKISAAKVASLALTGLSITGLSLTCLCACGEPLPSGQNSALSATKNIALTVDQESRIRTKILESIAKADETKNAEMLKNVMSGPALAIRSSQIKVASVGNMDLDPTSVIPKESSQQIIPITTDFPRTFMTITTTTEDQQSQRLLVFKQESVTENYKLWAVCRLVQNAKMPSFNVPATGSRVGASDDSGLVMTPAAAVEAYTDLLNKQDESEYKSAFEDDSFRTQLMARSATIITGLSQSGGVVKTDYAANAENMQVIRDADGGDLAVAQIDLTETRTVGSDRKSKPASAAENALFSGETTSVLEAKYTAVVALSIPKQGSEDSKIRIVAAEYHPVSIVAK